MIRSNQYKKARVSSQEYLARSPFKTKEMVEVKFLKSPTGVYGLGYSAGQVGKVKADLAKKMEKAGFCQIVSKPRTRRKAQKSEE